jgi:hypothetical protein
MELLPNIMTRVINTEEADPLIGSPCRCNSGDAREVQCRDCYQYEASCVKCFAHSHRNNPFHWANVWQTEKGFFQRTTLSNLGYPLHLGHNGDVCGSPKSEVGFIVVAETGPQALRLKFCGHKDGDEKLDHRVAQLLDARLFPCSFTEPKSAIAFNVLRQFQILHMESKIAAYDYCGSLRRMSDNVFTMSVPVSAILVAATNLV